MFNQKTCRDTEYETDCDSRELAEKLKDAQPINTRKTTSWAVSVYRRWAASRTHHTFVKTDLLDYGADVMSMSKASIKFFSEKYKTLLSMNAVELLVCVNAMFLWKVKEPVYEA